MAFKLVLERRAFIELDNALSYYSLINKKVGNSFIIEINKAFKNIIKNPYYQKRYEEFRVFPLKKFPLMIVYELDETDEIVRVFAIFNTLMDPQKLP